VRRSSAPRLSSASGARVVQDWRSSSLSRSRARRRSCQLCKLPSGLADRRSPCLPEPAPPRPLGGLGPLEVRQLIQDAVSKLSFGAIVAPIAQSLVPFSANSSRRRYRYTGSRANRSRSCANTSGSGGGLLQLLASANSRHSHLRPMLFAKEVLRGASSPREQVRAVSDLEQHRMGLLAKVGPLRPLSRQLRTCTCKALLRAIVK
jgi:hypothetical protein